jgi:hypothetical protein
MTKKPEYPCDVSGPPAFFVREINDIAPDCYLKFNSDLRTWQVWKDLDVFSDTDENGTRQHQKMSIVRAVFEALDQRALDNLRYRRWVGNRYMKDSQTYLRWLKKEEREAKAKEKEIALDMITEGLMKGYESSRRTYFT